MNLRCLSIQQRLRVWDTQYKDKMSATDNDFISEPSGFPADGDVTVFPLAASEGA